VITSKAFHICVTNAKDGVAQTTLERKIPLITIKSIATSNLRDDWFILNVGASEEGDPIIHCYFKTELAANLMTLTQASIQLLIGSTLDYTKKKEKRAQIKFIKDETVQKDDMYKSHTVHVPSGEPANSRSRLPAKRKAGVVRPITEGKLLRKGGPSGATSRPAAVPKPKPVAQPLPNGAARAAAPRGVPGPPTRAPAPPPPPPHDEPDVEMYRAKYAFAGQDGEMSLAKDDIVELVEKQGDWWLVKRNGSEGWAPNNYLELVPPKPKVAPAPPPPPPPASRRVPPAPGGGAATATPSSTRPKVTPAAASAPKAPMQSLTADSSAKPVSVFPGMAPGNGSTTPWKKPGGVVNSASADPTPTHSRSGSSLGSATKPPPPPVAGKKPPPIAAKPGAPKPPIAVRPGAGGPPKPPIPNASRPAPAPAANRSPIAVKPSGSAPGQLDLSAILARRAQQG